ncbi:beta-hexosaminidase [Alicycliphilus denitrificans]|uniref:beta-N-acetylhexosaminidase n=1 Tax=Alicycliphilus denitrificans TaxID=179636 RepID=UPI00095C9C52|nr:beta-N-acetylhexosaminidase [Alicycliphilus denitrificans]MBN9573393.1 beta-N-acetylhexosaminidase [Alicycliphilus denitrificans]OJW86923.1 MAG: beta-N-acetylhexosaminidase [Alicycliphilus sp. 69-12]BCN40115.1 beta-hexosaminidase [Alicycliphilus denitrificans]
MTEHAPLIIDVAGTQLSADDRRRLAHPLVGGVILFARNWQDRAQLLALTAAIKAVRHDLLVCVDHEGGRVQRFRTDGFTHIPPMRALGELWMDDGKAGQGSGALRAMDAATAAGYVLGSELRACGVDFSFTPVLDLDWGESGVIGDRAFHRDPRVVAMLARALMQGLLQAGMANCGKHFPGHGFVRADSHTEIPVDRRSLKAILADDAAPYPWLSTVLTSVMPAHVIYPKVDGRPAGFSAKWLQDILRGRLRFDGAIFSDDLSMEGARRIDGQVVSYTDAGVAALNAGCDLLLLCNQSLGDGQAVDELIAGLADAQAAGRWQASRASEARRQALLPETLPQPWDDLMVQPAYMHALDLLP